MRVSILVQQGLLDLDVDVNHYLTSWKLPDNVHTDAHDPRVVASDWWSAPGTCVWQEVAPTFSQFAQRLNLA